MELVVPRPGFPRYQGLYEIASHVLVTPPLSWLTLGIEDIFWTGRIKLSGVGPGDIFVYFAGVQHISDE
jgi:hypothetical protein